MNLKNLKLATVGGAHVMHTGMNFSGGYPRRVRMENESGNQARKRIKRSRRAKRALGAKP